MSARALYDHSRNGGLVAPLAEKHRSAFGHYPSKGERQSWANSLPALGRVLCDAHLDEVEVLIEQRLPLASLRADVILAGSHPTTGRRSYVVVELKQWSSATAIPDAADLFQVPGKRNHASLHPVVQVRRYCDYLRNFTNLLSDERDMVTGVVYLHNAADQDVEDLFPLADAEAPLYTETTRGALIQHLQTRLAPLNGAREADELLESPTAPGRQLMRAAAEEIIDGDQFLLMDEQQVAVSLVNRAVARAHRADRKEVIVVTGGPGSGKSLIALHLMGHLGRNGRAAVHATGSRSFTRTLRHVVERRNRELAHLFRYFIDFSAAERNGLDVLICDEAHRIRDRRTNGNVASQHGGRTQVEELIDAARVPVFLLDEHQVVRPGETGNVEDIDRTAHARGCLVRHVNLNNQFRCGGSRAYEAWVLRLLGLAPGGPVPWRDEEGFELLLANSPQELESHLRRQHEAGHTARMTAGFCWPWSAPRADGSLVDDVVIGDWRRPWNSKSDSSTSNAPVSALWATEQGGFGQIGCIYTAQGFEYPWNGTILGPDLVWRGDGWRAVPEASRDGSVATAVPDDFHRLIRNTYKVLLTRGLAGTVLYSTDAETQAKLRTLVPSVVPTGASSAA
ncbi:DUF2075 domain-containing protein [Streptomyces sp. DSM 44915]|uniref:DUF2075 domain-containing protein n=1 Tax=Streptomyces chisholmiae TaxID=3075540 RepID=A0ABU2JPR1_9ACTN|nr:DUF2075 domain-containing protein [Streptomyces sp. DSM 44915]MDT0266985.1 DUF2075 domain-containing protein [Streptomyces sp. DSM 44915]